MPFLISEIGHMMLSLATKFWEVLLSQAFCVGIGAGCLFTPSISILSTYFSKKIPTAIGLAACGSSLGEYEAVFEYCQCVQWR